MCGETEQFRRFRPRKVRFRVFLSCSACGESLEPELVPGGYMPGCITVWDEEELPPKRWPLKNRLGFLLRKVAIPA